MVDELIARKVPVVLAAGYGADALRRHMFCIVLCHTGKAEDKLRRRARGHSRNQRPLSQTAEARFHRTHCGVLPEPAMRCGVVIAFGGL